MASTNYSFEKRRRETDKKARKAERKARKADEQAANPSETPATEGGAADAGSNGGTAGADAVVEKTE